MNTPGGAQKRNEDSPIPAQHLNVVNRETLTQLTRAINCLDKFDLQVSIDEGRLIVTHPSIAHKLIFEGVVNVFAARAVAWMLDSMADTGGIDCHVEETLWGDR